MISKVFRYAIVGVIGTFTHFGILTLLVEAFNGDPVISSVVGFIITVIVSYYLNYRWTYKSSKKHKATLTRYLIVSLAGLCLNTAIIYVTVNILNLWYVIGQLIVVIVIPVHNFILNTYWSFKV